MRVLSLVGEKLTGLMATEAPEAEVVLLPADQPLPSGVQGDVLWSMASAPALHDLRAEVPWVHIHGTGVDVLPQGVYHRRIVTCARGATAAPIAEFVLAAMLAFEKQVPEIWVDQPPENWGWARLGGLSGKRLAVLGAGSIGTAVARLGIAFGMSVRALRRTAVPLALPEVDVVTTVVEAVHDADHVVVAVPATPLTRHLVSRDALAAMRRGVHLINIARGSLVDQDALNRAVETGHVARATLDTVEPEPLPSGHWMYRHPRIRLSPHVAWSSPAMGRHILHHFVDNLRARAAGRPLQGVIDPDAGY